MFEQHQPLIGQYARSHPDNMANVAIMCIITAHWPFDRVAHDFDQVVNRRNYSVLYGWKQNAVNLAEAFSVERFNCMQGLYATTFDEDTKETLMLAEVAQWHGLGFVKGGFFLQLCYGLSGCLDIRNAETYEIPQSELRAPRKILKSATRIKKAGIYNKLCKRLGGTAKLWDTWCDLYAFDYPENEKSKRFSTGWQVSAEHCRILGIDPGVEPEEVPF